MRLVLLHTNDIHGRAEAIARIATLVEEIERDSDAAVLYVDAGDVEETTNRLSNLTKGSAMHRLLSAAGCRAAVVGNAAVLRYGGQVLAEHAAAAGYPLLLANLRPAKDRLFPGVEASACLAVGALRLGLIGITSPMRLERPSLYENVFGYEIVPEAPLVRELAATLRDDGADVVILLSHLGLPADRELVRELDGAVDFVIGGHSHHLLPDGEWLDGTLIAHAGEYGQHVGRIDLDWTGNRVRVAAVAVVRVAPTLEPHPRVVAAEQEVEPEIDAFLDETLGELEDPLDWAVDRECAIANWMADILRERMAAEVGLAAAGHVFTGPLRAGPLTRGALWDICHSSANPGVTDLTGEQLQLLVERGVDPELAADTSARPLRGGARGLLHLSGAELRDGALHVGGRPVDPSRTYRVAGSDWELEPYGGYVPPEWALEVEYDMPTILREAVEEHMRGSPEVRAPLPRLGKRA